MPILLWLPMIGAHLLFFSGITLRTRLHNVDWSYLWRAARLIIPATIVGVLGLLNLPTTWILAFIYGVAMFYSAIWILNRAIHSRNRWVERFLLIVGGYIAGSTLSGAPLMVAVFMRNVSREQLRDTLFVLWFVLVTIKMSTFAAFGVNLNLLTALALLPVAGIGHFAGLKVHEAILRNDQQFKRWVGSALFVVSALGLWQLAT